MDADIQRTQEPELPAMLAVEQVGEPGTGPITEFEHFLLTRCSITQSEDELWRCLAQGVARLEQSMDARQIDRFEIAIDVILSRQGLPGWAVIKHRMSHARRKAATAASSLRA